jgi:hypothetical protein|nr:MAG TPA: hypothetical protein [Caudoviricetes sp.]
MKTMIQTKILQAVLYALTTIFSVIFMIRTKEKENKYIWFGMALCWIGAFIGKIGEII